LSVYGPNGLVRYFNGSLGSGAAALDVRSSHDRDDDRGALEWNITNVAASHAEVHVLDACTGELSTWLLPPGDTLKARCRWIGSTAGTTSSSRLPGTRLS